MTISLWQWAVFILVLYFIVSPIYSAFFFIRPPRFRISFRQPSDLGLAFRSVTFTSSDGAELRGWFLPGRNEAAVILLHPHGANRLAVFMPMEALARAGFGVVLFDLRAHGSSEGHRFPPGRILIDDVMAALAFTRRQPEVNARRVGLLGIGYGAMLALQAAAAGSHVAAVIADSPTPARIADVPPAGLWGRIQLPRRLLYARVVRRLIDAEPLPPLRDAIRRIAPRPLLLIAPGTGRELELARDLYALAGEPRHIWEVPEAPPGIVWQKGRETIYAQRIVSFFNTLTN